MIALLGDMCWPVDLVTAVPIGTARKKERGYNQAALLALPLALGSGIPYSSKGLIKIRETRSQVGLNVQQRNENVFGVFRANSRLVNGKYVLVVDDVTTSGATMQACARALLEAGACGVYGLTLARAVRY
jgi:ComF family protein